jgi:hypothetical protein
MNVEKHTHFLGLYFNKDTILRLVSVGNILSWVVVGVYAMEFLVQGLVMVLQIARGFWTGIGLTDAAQLLLNLFEQPLRGIVYFIVLQGLVQALLMFMDIEDNTRRSARVLDK